MNRRQTDLPEQWLIVDERSAEMMWPALRRLPRGSGVLVLFHGLSPRERQRLLRRIRIVAQEMALTVVDEAGGTAARVHNMVELRRALLARTPILLLSPLFPTRSHPGRQRLARMRAAAMARLGHRRLLALGGMDKRRFRYLRPLGFAGWAGIDAWQSLSGE